jgi:hypothetical protein
MVEAMLKKLSGPEEREQPVFNPIILRFVPGILPAHKERGEMHTIAKHLPRFMSTRACTCLAKEVAVLERRNTGEQVQLLVVLAVVERIQTFGGSES